MERKDGVNSSILSVGPLLTISNANCYLQETEYQVAATVNKKMEEYDDISFPLPAFDGTELSFPLWWMQMEAYASVYGFREALSTVAEADLPEADMVSHSENPSAAAATKRNNICVACLFMACNEETVLFMWLEGCTAEWPGGLAHRMVKGLVGRYTPSILEFQYWTGEASYEERWKPRGSLHPIDEVENSIWTCDCTRQHFDCSRSSRGSTSLPGSNR
jgi:hypothetical protein